MAALDDFEKSLRGVKAAQRRPQPVLTNAERTAILEAVRPFFEAYEAQIEAAQAGDSTGPTWYGYDNEGNEYTGEQKQEVLEDWKKAWDIPEDAKLLRSTIGEPAKPGPRARGPVTFYTYPTASAGLHALWIAKNDDLALLQGMVASTSDENEDE